MLLSDNNYKHIKEYSFNIDSSVNDNLSVIGRIFEKNPYSIKKEIENNSNKCKITCGEDKNCGGFIYNSDPDRTCYFFNKSVNIKNLPKNNKNFSNYTLFKYKEPTVVKSKELNIGSIIIIILVFISIILCIIFVLQLYGLI